MAIDLRILGRSVKQAQWRHHRGLDRRLAEIGTTITQWDALRTIAERPGASAHDLAIATFQSDQSFGTLANRLAAQGLIERSPGQGRRVEHRVSPAGHDVLAAAAPIVEGFLAESFRGLSEAEREQLGELLDRLG